MSELIQMTKVFIIESPSKDDIDVGRNEGSALGKTLDLATIKNKVFTVSTVERLRNALLKIALEVNEIKAELGLVHLHFSMHGSEDGLTLTDEKIITWQEFHNIINKFNDTIKYIESSNGLKIAPTSLTFSVCKGFSATKIKDFGEENTYTALIGPTESVGWADSLLAFSIFFHNTILKKTGLATALKNMNETVGLDNVFQADVCKGLIIK